MSLKEQLINAAKPYLMKEGLESSKEIIDTNSVDIESMGVATNAPGEFSQAEITDRENLVNTTKLSNDTDFNKEDKCPECDCEVEVSVTKVEEPSRDEVLADLVNLGKDEDKEHRHEHLMKAFESILMNNTFSKDLKESDYAGNLSYNPDKRLNASDILNAVKNAVKPELAPALSVVKNVDANEEPSYAIQNIDEKDLPEKLEIDTNTDKKVVLKKDGNSYKFDK